MKINKENFVNLHGHSGFSLYDGFSLPNEHMDFAYENGSPSLALTDHGHANGQSYQILHAQKMKKEGKKFKPIYGVEAYFVHSLKDWYPLHEKVKIEDKKIKSEENSGGVIEDETSTKSRSKFDCLTEEENRLYRRSHLILLARNQRGLNNIYSLISESYKGGNFFRFPRIDFELLKQFKEDIIVTNACAGGVLANDYWNYNHLGEDAVKSAMRDTIAKFKNIVGENFFGEIQWNTLEAQHAINKHIISLKDEMDIKIVSTADSHYPRPEMWKDRELYKRLNPKFLNYENQMPTSVESLGYELYPKNAEQMWDSFTKYSQLCGQNYNTKDVLESFENTHHIAFNLIEDFQPDTTIRLPNFIVPEGETAEESFEKAAWEGLKKKELDNNPEYTEQLKEEIEVIKNRGFSKYFLTMKAICDESKDMMLMGNGRGSAAGALTSYVLDITQVNPKKFNLLFSRFLRSDQTDYPDVDSDFSDAMALKEHLIKKWGDDNVVPISNWNKLSLKSVIKDVAKYYGIPFATVNQITKSMMLEAIPSIKKERGIKSGVIQDPTLSELKRNSKTLNDFLKENPEVDEQLENIVNQVKSVSRHAGGVVIGENLNKHMPLIYSGGVRQTPWSEGANVKHLEPLGFIKFDILGLSTLKMFEDCISLILEKQNGKKPSFKEIKNWYEANLHPDKINLNDKKVFDHVFCDGNFAGTFQFTENFAQKFCKTAKPKSIVDISAITSLARPGPMGAKAHTSYLDTRDGKLKPKYFCKEHKEITESTFGFLVFQEQIMLLAHKLGKNITLEEGGKLEKALRKKRQKALENPEIKALKENLREGCLEKGMTEENVEELWDNFASFAQYGFNLSHATCYSIISYQCAWLFTYFPNEWMAAFLNREGDDPKKREKSISVAKSHGFSIHPVDINKSKRDWTIDGDRNLLEPFKNILGLGDKAIEEIMEYRPFSSVEELLFNEKMDYRKFSKRALLPLAKSGGLSSLQDDRFFGDKHFCYAVAEDRPKTIKKLLENIEKYRELGSFSKEEKIKFAIELSGQYPIELVLSSQIREALRKQNIPQISDFEPGNKKCWFVLREQERKMTKNGKPFLVLSVIDESGKITKIRCWGESHSDMLYNDHSYLASLDYDVRYGFSVRGIKQNFRILQ